MVKPDQLGSSRKALFRIITMALPLIFLVLVEGILRMASYGADPHLFIPNPREGYEKYLILNPDVGKKYFSRLEYDAPSNDIFLKKKEEGSFRIFVMGSSTVAGFPYEDNLMFSRILHRRLEDAFPGRRIEVVNTAITAINSHTLLDFSREIAGMRPDAVLIYAGHNEFYGAFGTGSNEGMSRSRLITRVHLGLMECRTYQFLRNIMLSTVLKGREGGDELHGTLMKRVVASRDIPLDGELYRLTMKRYRQNMEAVIERFATNGIPVFLSEVVSNEKDIKPLSVTASGMMNEAGEAYAAAEEALGKGENEKARELYNRAIDLDGVRFRATGEVNLIVRELASRRDVHLVPMLETFRSASPGGIIGNSLMTEHVHPNIAGSFLMAEAFFREILSSGLPGMKAPSEVYPIGYCRLNWGYTALDSLLAHHRITNLKTHWPFVPLDKPVADYRVTYSPGSETDSLAFHVFRDPSQSLAEARLQLAVELEERGDLPGAAHEYEALLCMNPYVGVNYRDAASVLIRLGDLPLAYGYFRKSLEWDPSFYASYRMGEILLIKGDYMGARDRFREAFDSTGDSGEKLKALGKIYQSCIYGNQQDDALVVADQLKKYNATQYLSIPPRSYSYMKHIPYRTREKVEQALELISSGDDARALSLLEKSLEIYDSHIARRYMGEICIRTGNTRKALENFENIEGEFAYDPAFLQDFIYLYSSSGDSVRASGLLEQLKKIDPGNKGLESLTRIITRE